MSELTLNATPGRNGKADIACLLGADVIHRDKIDPRKADDRKRYGKAVTDKMPGISADDVDRELLKTSEALDNHKDAEQPGPDIMRGREVDVSRIIRPELITRPDFSALAIPRFIEGPDGLVGGWMLYRESPAGRDSGPIVSDYITTPDGERLYLSPMPGAPTPTDVAELCRWSEESRLAWLDGEPAPTTFDVLESVVSKIDRYVYLPDEHRIGTLYTLACWVLLTYAFRSLRAVPYIRLGGPADSGKSTVMAVLEGLVWRPAASSSMKGPTLFRTLHGRGSTLLLDEAERLRGDSPDVEELRAMLLAGYKAGGVQPDQSPSVIHSGP